MSKILNFFGYDKAIKLANLVKVNGGIINTLLSIHRMDVLKEGKLVGVDKYGNKYYQNDKYIFGRNRWVVYAEHKGYNYDASQIPAEWYGWMHYKTDYLPHEDPGRPKYDWMQDHVENMTGTPEAYMPYSTTKPKIEAWKPPSAK